MATDNCLHQIVTAIAFTAASDQAAPAAPAEYEPTVPHAAAIGTTVIRTRRLRSAASSARRPSDAPAIAAAAMRFNATGNNNLCAGRHEAPSSCAPMES